MRNRLIFSSLFLFAVLPCSGQQKLAQTPPMGWNSWNHFGASVTEADVRATADMLVSTGMRDAGYVYVNIDDGWQGKRDSKGVIHPDERFPDMKALGDYLHAKGLKFGIYSSPGFETCARFEGSLGHERQDAATYASWGVDYLKYDLCSFDKSMEKEKARQPQQADAANQLMIDAYRKMGEALTATGRPIVYSICQYGVGNVWEWGPGVGAQLWRTTDDISDTYTRMAMIGFSQAGFSKFAGPGHWNDPDMLEVGNGKMSGDEYRLHMGLWALLAAPLLAGNDLNKMSKEDRNILMNREVIAIDQDSLGKQGERIVQGGDVSIWSRPLSGGRTAVGVVLDGTIDHDVVIDLARIGFLRGAHLRDVWAHKDLGFHKGLFSARLHKHSILLLVAGE